MRRLLYRLDSNVTSSYAEYLEKRYSCEKAHPFLIEGTQLNESIPSSYEEVEKFAVIPIHRP